MGGDFVALCARSVAFLLLTAALWVLRAAGGVSGLGPTMVVGIWVDFRR
jgi:hypothetical protein